jgi:hydrogenase expression/formation protein HypC
MCLAIPGRIVEMVDETGDVAKVEVGGVRRNVNVALLDAVSVGDYVLIHVGFALSKVDEHEAMETLRLLEELGAYQDELDQYSLSDATG